MWIKLYWVKETKVKASIHKGLHRLLSWFLMKKKTVNIFLLSINVVKKRKEKQRARSARKNLDDRFFTRGRVCVLFRRHLAVVNDEVFFFLAFPDANASCGFESKKFSSALRVTREEGKRAQRMGQSVNNYLYLFIFGVDEYDDNREPVEHI